MMVMFRSHSPCLIDSYVEMWGMMWLLSFRVDDDCFRLKYMCFRGNWAIAKVVSEIYLCSVIFIHYLLYIVNM